MMPGLPGTEVYRQLRQRGPVPVIMVTARDSEIDKVVGLELGADDYVTKPFSQRELVARIRAVLRRGQDVELVPDVVEAAGVRMDVERHEVSVDGERVKLALKEFELLEILLRNAGRVMTRSQLIDRIWGADYVGDTKTLDVHVKRLRTKIEARPGQPEAPDHRPRPGLQVRGLIFWAVCSRIALQAAYFVGARARKERLDSLLLSTPARDSRRSQTCDWTLVTGLDTVTP